MSDTARRLRDDWTILLFWAGLALWGVAGSCNSTASENRARQCQEELVETLRNAPTPPSEPARDIYGPSAIARPSRASAFECRSYCQRNYATEATYSGDTCTWMWILEPDDYPIDPE
jgi:hypothetical protein